MAKRSRRKLGWVRAGVQTLALLVFFWLFRITDYNGSDNLPAAVNWLFRLDPLSALSAILASRAWIPMMIPALVIAIATIVLGRFFCGWLCPLGALLDLFHRLFPHKQSGAVPKQGIPGYLILAGLLATSLFGLNLTGLLNPFSILVRGLTLGVDPVFHRYVTSLFTVLYLHAPSWITVWTEPLYRMLRDTVLPFRQVYFALAFTSTALLVSVFILERFSRRYWCRMICPAGALFSLLSRFSLLRGSGGGACGACEACRSVCRTGAIDERRAISSEACVLCMDCLDVCPRDFVRFGFRRPRERHAAVDVPRRALIGATLTGLIAPGLLAIRAPAGAIPPGRIRPPGAIPEPDFLARCVRCGECMKVCPGNALHPALVQAGPEGLFTPVLLPRAGYCEFNCTLCGQVCPTGAIRTLTQDEKHRTVIGLAWFDKNRCLPHALGTPCIVCEEHCPTPDKAIKFHEVSVPGQEGLVKQPYVVPELCIGCGICETKCPLPGPAAVHVQAVGEGIINRGA